MRKITELIIHCSATPEGRDYTVADIDRWHKAKGWKSIGYHYVIYRDGSIHIGRPKEQIGAHCVGHNAHSLGICYIGGLRPTQPPLKGGEVTYKPADTRTEAQKAAMHTLIAQLLDEFPGATLHGHNEFSNKACPSFKVPSEL